MTVIHKYLIKVHDLYAFWGIGSGVTYVTIATSEQLNAGTALLHARQVGVLPNIGPVESGPTTRDGK